MKLNSLYFICILHFSCVPLLGDEGSRRRSPVYFPVIVEDFEDLGTRFSIQNPRFQSSPSFRPGAILPVTSPKPTTTTNRLPIAQQSHVVQKDPQVIPFEVPPHRFVRPNTNKKDSLILRPPPLFHLMHPPIPLHFRPVVGPPIVAPLFNKVPMTHFRAPFQQPTSSFGPSKLRFLAPQPQRASSRNPFQAVTVNRRPLVALPSRRLPSVSFERNSFAASVPRKEYRQPITFAPQKSPVFSTSTKTFQTPMSLFGLRESRPTVTVPLQPDFIQTTDRNIYVPQEYDKSAIPGKAGIDYPVFGTVPDTGFQCEDQSYAGLYADVEAKCQTFHICQENGRQDTFLCPNGTVFNQQYFVCDWWYNFACESATRFYSLNEFIYEYTEPDKYRKK